MQIDWCTEVDSCNLPSISLSLVQGPQRDLLSFLFSFFFFLFSLYEFHHEGLSRRPVYPRHIY